MKQIFLVEDDQGIRELIEYLLISQEYLVQSFQTAAEFKKRINNQLPLPDLILMDIMLPDGNGLELCKDLNASKSASHIPVVLMSAHTSDYSIKAEDCVSDFIAKPFDIDDFISRIARQLN